MLNDRKNYYKTYYDVNKEKLTDKNKTYYENNKEIIKKRTAIYQKNNIEKTRLYKTKHKNKVKEKARRFIYLYKTLFGRCSCCGYNKNITCLDFHHLRDKKNSISKMVLQGYSIKLIKEEIKKCKLLCANCHRKTHTKKLYCNNKKSKMIYQFKLNKKCNNCGNSDPVCLEYHHVDKKNFQISNASRDKHITESDILNELNLCILLCSNCHREHHNNN